MTRIAVVVDPEVDAALADRLAATCPSGAISVAE